MRTSTMQVADLRWYPYSIPLRDPFITAHGALSHRRGVMLDLRFENGTQGYGECAPLPEFGGAHLDEILDLLPGLARELCSETLETILSAIENWSQDSRLPAPLLYGLETALLDAWGQVQGQGLAALLGPQPPRLHIPVNAVIGEANAELAAERAAIATVKGFRTLKIKLPPPQRHSVSGRSLTTLDESEKDKTHRYMQEIIARVAMIRDVIGPEPLLRLDANESWNFEQAMTILKECSTYAIQYVEQPLPAHNLTDMARLRRNSPIPIAADEALSDIVSVRQILEMEAADVLILKPQLLGGLRVCQQIIREAQKQGIACVITSTIEAGIGVTAALHLAAASPEVMLACGLATLDLLTTDLLTESPLLQGGQISLPAGSGLGVHLDSAMLKAVLTETRLDLTHSREG